MLRWSHYRLIYTDHADIRACWHPGLFVVESSVAWLFLAYVFYALAYRSIFRIVTSERDDAVVIYVLVCVCVCHEISRAYCGRIEHLVAELSFLAHLKDQFL